MVVFMVIGMILLLMYLNHVDGMARRIDEQIEKISRWYDERG